MGTRSVGECRHTRSHRSDRLSTHDERADDGVHRAGRRTGDRERGRWRRSERTELDDVVDDGADIIEQR